MKQFVNIFEQTLIVDLGSSVKSAFEVSFKYTNPSTEPEVVVFEFRALFNDLVEPDSTTMEWKLKVESDNADIDVDCIAGDTEGTTTETVDPSGIKTISLGLALTAESSTALQLTVGTNKINIAEIDDADASCLTNLKRLGGLHYLMTFTVSPFIDDKPDFNNFRFSTPGSSPDEHRIFPSKSNQIKTSVME